MKQLVILSGKGGTGKTSLTAAFAHLAKTSKPHLKSILADADVDAANLGLVLHPETKENHDFIGGSLAVIDPDLCQSCGTCQQVCRFDAVIAGTTIYKIDPVACEGCAACVYQCPELAIIMQPQHAGQWYCSESPYGPFYHAELKPAQENSGKLVTLVKQQARLAAMDGEYPLLIVDGPPGIGCPVISAISGADLALVVTEPTAAGIHDLQRIVETTAHFRVPTWVCINKADLFPEATEKIENFCQEKGLPLIGHIPFDENVTHAMIKGQPVTSCQPDSPASKAILKIWQELVNTFLSRKN